MYTQSLTVEGRIRFDNLFDRVNRYCLSVFKGVDLGFGYAWYQSDEGDLWGSSEFGRTTPFVNLRATWTFLYGFQLSYSLRSCRPASGNDEFTEFHSVRFRLLLRDVLPAQAGKAYHPDIEFAFDTGRRLPLFEREEKGFDRVHVRAVSVVGVCSIYPRSESERSIAVTGAHRTRRRRAPARCRARGRRRVGARMRRPRRAMI